MHFKVLFSRQAGKVRHGITKTLLVMKLTSILLLGACLQVSARVHSQTVSFSGNNVPLEKVFAAVEKQTGYVFFFDEAILKTARSVTIKAENYPLSLFLSCVLNGQSLRFSFQNKTIVVSRQEPPPAPAPPIADTTANPSGQPVIAGVVMDVNNEPLPGASITVKETGKSTLTDAHGAFNLPVPSLKSKVVISYVGYTSREMPAEEVRRQFLLQLTVAVNTLDEEVVQGYGKTSQRLSVSNIVKVSGEELHMQPVMNPLLALNGKVSGLLVTPTSGYLSAPVKLELRGRSTIDPSQVSDPLYVIDGVPLTILDIHTTFNTSSYANGSTGFFQAGLFSNTKGQSPLFSINPADIESVSVLKDAAATSIYGSRGANGVVLITTKKTKPGKTTLNASMQQSVSSAPRHWDMLNTKQYLQMRRETVKNDGLPATIAYIPELAWDSTRYTDWQKALLGVAKSTEVSLGLSGGDQTTAFNVNAGYNQSQDITTLSGSNKRLDISSRLSHRSSNQKLTLDLSTLYSYTYVKAITIPSLITLAPNAPPIFDSKGKLNYTEWNAAGLSNTPFPFSSVLVPSTTSNNYINASLSINYNIARGFNASILGGYSNAQTTSAWYNAIAAQNPISNPLGYAGFGYSSINNWNLEPQLNYTRYIGPGRLECMFGGTVQSSSTKGTTMTGSGYTNDALLQSISNAPNVSSGQQTYQKMYASIRGRITYNWRNKYILEATGNRDGSSNFGPGRQYGNFWSVGSAWIASEESWAKRLLPSWWSFLKLNASYGTTGTDNGGAYQYLSQWSSLRDYYGAPLLYNGVVPMTPQHAVNQDYQWQEKRKINADLTMSFLHDRITAILTWYNERCNNQLTTLPTPIYTGFTSVTGNSPANVENTGYEASTSAYLVKKKEFTWNFTFNIGINRNKLISYPNFALSPYFTTKKIGASLNTVYLLHYLGINPMNGKRSYEDYNHDGLITLGSGVSPGTFNDDKHVALDATPKYMGGFSNQFIYRQWMLSFSGIYKKQLQQLPYVGTGGAMGNIPQDIYNTHWQKPGDQAQNPRFATTLSTSDSQFGQSDGSYADASFIRLSNVVIGYSLPAAACKKLHMQGASFSVNMENVFLLTSYKGLDPDVTFGIVPQPRIIAGRASFNF